MRIVKLGLSALQLVTLFSALSYSATDRIAAISSGQMISLSGNVHHKALLQYDQGPVDPSFQLTYVTLLTSPTPSQAKALEDLLAQQQNPKSPNYHKWLTPEQWADRFGLSTGDVQKLTDWLKSQGLKVVSVANGRNWIVFSGTASQIQNALGAEIHNYNVDGEMHFANASAPKIPSSLSGIISGFRGLNNFRPKPRAARSLKANPNYYDSSFPAQFLAPGDVATIYDIDALYSAGIDGTGQKLAIAGQTDVYLADLNDFRSGFNLPTINCTANSSGFVTTACNTSNFRYILNGPDAAVSLGDLTEADLDLEWSAAIAKNAQIIYVNSPATANGVWDSWYYAVDNTIAPVISLSYGNCEFDNNNVLNPTSGLPAADETELMKANSEGITFFNSSGDSGAAECDRGTNSATNNLAVNGLAVSYPASSPEVTGVGGTAIIYPTGFSSTYWGTTNGTDGSSAIFNASGFLEQAWNDDEELVLMQSGTTQLSWQESYAIVSTGGGVSNCAKQTTDNASCVSGFPKPSWQTVTIPNQANVRFTPDVSLLGSPNFPGYIFCTAVDAWISTSTSSASSCAPGGTAGITNALALTDGSQPSPTVVGGTSAAAPVFAAIMTLINQKLSTPKGQGNINPTLYKLAATPSNGVFHPVTTGDNNVYCEGGTPSVMPVAMQCPGAVGTTGILGYSASNADATTGYNLVTGLGSVDANKLADAWPSSLTATSTSLVAAPTSVNQGDTVTLTATVTPSTATGSVSFYVNGSSTAVGSATLSSGVATLTTTLPAGTDSVTATYAGDSSNATSTSSAVTVTVAAVTLTLSTNATSFPILQGQSVNVTVTASATPPGFSGNLTYTCTDPASESLCTGPTGPIAFKTPASFKITTTAATGRLERLFERKIFYAALLPGLFGIMFTLGSSKRSLRGMRMLGLIMVLGFSTLWLGSCGGTTSSSSSNPGTPKQSYNFVINATSGGANAVTGSVTFTVVVQ